MRMLWNCALILGGAFILPLALSAQTFTTLYTFSSQDDGAYWPIGGVIPGPHGELYGASYTGGKSGYGTVYELLPPPSSGGAWTEVVLHSFDSGDSPAAGLALGPSGSLYGVAANIDFQLDPPTGASSHWSYTVIYQGTTALGGGLVFGPPLGDGQTLYGTSDCGAVIGGDSGCDVVYRLTPPPAAGGAWTYTTIYTFPIPVQSQGALVDGSLAVGAGGTLFGVTEDGGYDYCDYGLGCGTVFSLTPPAAPGGPWTEAILYAFKPGIGDGFSPFAGVVIGPGGVLFGTTMRGGHGTVGGSGFGGTAFSLTPPAVPGSPMTETVLHAFCVSAGDGCSPVTPLVLGPNGVMYGTTSVGGASGYGTVFELVPPASPGGVWTETILHSFANGVGSTPNGLTLAPNGTLYGTTQGEGSQFGGTVFAITP